MKVFVPYFTHIASVDLFFYFAIAADLIGRGRASHKVDIAYLYYLPFCMVFTSNDNLHKQVVPLFLRPNQTFVAGTDLKADLQKLNQYYDSLPPDVKDRGMFSFAFYPPDDNGFLLSNLWDKHMNPKWREHKKERENQPFPPENNEAAKSLMEKIRKFEEDASPKSFASASLDEADHLAIRRTVRAKKGKWERFPPEVRNRRKNKDGEWENIPPGEPG